MVYNQETLTVWHWRASFSPAEVNMTYCQQNMFPLQCECSYELNISGNVSIGFWCSAHLYWPHISQSEPDVFGGDKHVSKANINISSLK